MFRVKLTDFRCFADTVPLEVRPITFLVGENSTGKTSFLAAVRQLLESFSRSSQNPFNRDPYFLGGFDQIARYRGGRGGRAKSFSLELTLPASAEPAAGKAPKQSSATSHRFTFVKGTPQPELTEYKFVSANSSVTLTLTDKPRLTVDSFGQIETFELDTKRLPPIAMVRRDVSFLRFIFDEVVYGLRKEKEANWRLADAETFIKLFNESMRFAAVRRIFASSPVRTQPLRTYTPSEMTPSSEGSHVPLEMARQKISAPAEWDSVHKKLANFGQESGLFDDIDIRLLGKRDGDPFQIMVRTKGPPVNIVDVGYGVSQALPIVYQLEHSRSHDVYLLQQPEVHLHPRAQAALGTLVAGLSRQKPNTLYVLETHSDFIIDRVRTEVAQGKLDHRSVTIIFFERLEHEVRASNIYLNSVGEIADPPPSFRTFFLEEHARLLGV